MFERIERGLIRCQYLRHRRHDMIMADLVKQWKITFDEQWIGFRHVTLLISEKYCHQCHPNLAKMWHTHCLVISCPRRPITAALRRLINPVLGARCSWDDPSYACNSNASLGRLFLISYAMPKEIVPFLLRTSYYESPFIIEGSLFSHGAKKECGARANGSPTSFIEGKTLSAAVHSTHV